MLRIEQDDISAAKKTKMAKERKLRQPVKEEPGARQFSADALFYGERTGLIDAMLRQYCN